MATANKSVDGRNLQIIFEVGKNGSINKIIFENTGAECSNDHLVDAIIGILIVFLLVGFILNIVLIATISTSYTLRRSPFSYLLINIALANILECLLNMSVSIGFMRTQPWEYGKVLCGINGYSYQLIPCIISLTLMLLWIDRALALNKPLLYRQRITGLAHLGLSILIWCLAIFAALPIVLDLFEVWPLPKRMSCSMVNTAEEGNASIMWYSGIVLSGCVGFPAIVLIICIFTVCCTLSSETRRDKKIKSRHSITEAIFRTPRLLNESLNVKTAVLILLLYIPLCLPNIVMTYVDQLTLTHNQTYIPGSISDHCSQKGKLHLLSNSSSTSGMLPELYDLPQKEHVFMWLRYLFAVLCPAFVFAFRRDISDKCCILICFWRNSPNSARPITPSIPIKVESEDAATVEIKKKKKDLVNFRTPVLFATAEGLHLRLIDTGFDKEINSKRSWMGLNLSKSNNEQPSFVFHMCDLFTYIDDSTPEMNVTPPNIGDTPSYKMTGLKSSHDWDADSGYIKSDNTSPQSNMSSVDSDISQEGKRKKKTVKFDSFVLEIPRTADSERSFYDQIPSRSPSPVPLTQFSPPLIYPEEPQTSPPSRRNSYQRTSKKTTAKNLDGNQDSVTSSGRLIRKPPNGTQSRPTPTDRGLQRNRKPGAKKPTYTSTITRRTGKSPMDNIKRRVSSKKKTVQNVLPKGVKSRYMELNSSNSSTLSLVPSSLNNSRSELNIYDQESPTRLVT